MADTRALLIFNNADADYAQYVLERLAVAHSAPNTTSNNWELKLEKHSSSTYTYPLDSRTLVQTYDWFILLRTSHLLADQNVDAIVNTALTAVSNPQSQTRLQNILAIGEPVSEHANKWATIRTYDITSSSKTDFEKAIHQLYSSLIPVAQPRRGRTGLLPSVDSPPAQNKTNPLTHPDIPTHRSSSPVSSQSWVIMGVLACVVLLVITGVLFAFEHPNLPFIVNKPTPTTIISTMPPLHPSPTPVPTTSPEDALLKSVTAGQPVFSDPLEKTFTKNNPLGWDTNKNDGCQIADDGYHVINTQLNQFTPCMAKQSSYQNFAYQVQLNLNGDAAGLVLRADSQLTHFYRFSFSADGKYSLISCTKACSHPYDVHQGAGIASGNIVVNNQATLTVIVKNDQFHLYIDGTSVGKALDGSVSGAGSIGLYADSTTPGLSTEAIFSNMRIWNIK